MPINPVLLSGGIKAISKVGDIVDQFVEDKDAKNRINAELELVRYELYLKELDTKTIPWVDGLHKMGRQILSVINVIAVVFIIYVNPDVDPLQLAAIAGPTGIYAYIKGRGK